MKNQKGLITDHRVPPLNCRNGLCTSSTDKAQLVADHFAEKMTIQDADSCLAKISKQTNKSLESVSITERAVLNELRSLNTAKACGPDFKPAHSEKLCSTAHITVSSPVLKLLETESVA